jgi:hypothetical protein
MELSDTINTYKSLVGKVEAISPLERHGRDRKKI